MNRWMDGWMDGNMRAERRLFFWLLIINRDFQS